MMALVRSSRLALVPILLAVTACGGNGTTVDPPDGGGDTTDAGGGGTSRRLAVVGSPLLQVEAGSTTELQVDLIQDELGPVANETVSFAILGLAGGSTVSAPSAVTDVQGLADTTLAAGSSEATFQVTASAPGANQVAFAVQVIKRKHYIRISKTPSVRVAADGVQATVETAAFGQVLLRVRVSDQFGEPVVGAPVAFGFQQAALSAAIENVDTPPVTDLGGEAQVTLDTGKDLSDSFVITGRTDLSPTAKWYVTLSDADVKLCQSNSECPPGQHCNDNGICEGVPGCDPAEGVDCPTGYKCTISGECEAVFSAGCQTTDECGAGYECQDGTCVATTEVCNDQNPCPGGYVCSGGACEPTGTIPDISGGWYTAHTFHIQDALPGIVGDLAGPIRTIDRLLLGDLGLPGWLQSLFDGLIDRYVSDDIQTAVHILDTIMTLLNDLRARGYMTVNQTKGSGAWTASEVWNSFVFYYLPKCGSSPGGDPTPACARVNLLVDDPDTVAELGLKVHDFNGTVAENLVIVNDRDVEMRIGKLVGILADYLIHLLTKYDTVSEAIVGSVDCQAISDAVSDWVGDVTGVCKGLVKTAADQVTQQLYNLAFDVGLLEFHGQATVETDANDRGTSLGSASWEQDDDGSYDGRFTKILEGVPGQWHASRRTIP